MTALADLDVSDPSAADIAAAQELSRGFDQLARELEDVAGQFSSDDSVRIRDGLAHIALVRNGFDAEAMACAQAAAALADQREAGDRWLRDAPKRADILAARTAVDDARAAMVAAANAYLPTAALVGRLEAAQQNLRDLEDRRKAADDAYYRACTAARAKLPRDRGKCKPGKPGERDYTGAGKGGTTPPTPAPSPMPAPPTRIGAAPPATTPAAPTVSAPVSPAMPTVPANVTAPAPVAPTALSAQMPPMPQVIPAGAAQSPRRDTDGTAVDTPDLDGLLAAGTAPAAAAPRPAAAVAAPVAAPAPAPVATNPGFSANGLVTDAPLSGRPTPAPGAYSAPTGLSGGHAAQQVHAPAGTEAGTRAGTGAPMHAPMMPGVGGVPGAGAGGGGSRDRDPIVRHSSLGMESVAEAVPGGTIARRDKKSS